MEPLSQPNPGKEPITQEIDQDELRRLIGEKWQEGLQRGSLIAEAALRQAQARQRLRAKVAKWIERRRREGCQ